MKNTLRLAVLAALGLALPAAAIAAPADNTDMSTSSSTARGKGKMEIKEKKSIKKKGGKIIKKEKKTEVEKTPANP